MKAIKGYWQSLSRELFLLSILRFNKIVQIMEESIIYILLIYLASRSILHYCSKASLFQDYFLLQLHAVIISNKISKNY